MKMMVIRMMSMLKRMTMMVMVFFEDRVYELLHELGGKRLDRDEDQWHEKAPK